MRVEELMQQCLKPSAHRRTRRWVRRAFRPYFSRIGIVRSTGTTVTLFFGEPSMTRSE